MSEGKKILAYEDFLPKTKEVFVGDAQLIISEYTIAKRDSVIKVLLSSAGIVDAILPVFQKIREAGTMDGYEFVFGLKDVVAKIFGKELSRISCISLDTPKNRALVALDKSAVEMDSDGILGCPDFHRFVAENLTVRQEQALLESIFEVNDFAELIKKYVDLLGKALQTAGQKSVEPKSQD